MGVISGFHHVKLPVADVSRSRDWYGRVLGFQVALEFVEDGVVMGLALRDPSGTVRLAVRHDPVRAAALSGFDPIALAVPARADVQAWRAHLDDLGEPTAGSSPATKGVRARRPARPRRHRNPDLRRLNSTPNPESRTA
jgi:catechol 2,3-dioxygenase-like lactoylglutathione lyase family enzyme